MVVVVAVNEMHKRIPFYRCIPIIISTARNSCSIHRPTIIVVRLSFVLLIASLSVPSHISPNVYRLDYGQ